MQRERERAKGRSNRISNVVRFADPPFDPPSHFYWPACNVPTDSSLQTCPMKGRPEDSFLEHFSERFMDHVRQVCTFAKLVPGFKGLHHDDQVTLLKSCVFEVLLVRLSGLFDNQVSAP